MKTSASWPCLVICFLVMVAGCKEEPPYINYKPSSSTIDSNYIDAAVAGPDQKEVLLEDVTGVKCKNCPQAAAIARSLKQTHDGKMNIIAMQPMNYNPLLTSPYHTSEGAEFESSYDYRTVACITICDLLKRPGSLPSGYIDRKVFAPATEPVLAKEDWANKVGTQVALPSPVNIKLSGQYNEAAGTITIDVNVRYTSTINAAKKHNLSIAITQDSTIDVQENDNVFDSAYVSMHLLRDMVTAYTGDALNAPLVSGRTFVRRYVYKIPPTNFSYAPLVIKHCHLVAYVHESSESGKEVIQSQEAEYNEVTKGFED